MTTSLRKARTAVTAVAALAATASALSACSDSAAEPGAQGEPSATSGATTPVTLRLGTDDEADRPGGEQILHFAEEVAQRSDGALTIEPVWHAGGDQSHWDQYVAHMVIDGELDLGLVPTRAWDDLGVDSLRALNAPFLITTDTLTASVVTDDDLVEQLTSGLPDAGVTALGLFPEGLRHPFGFDRVLGGPADYEGGVVRSAYSRTTEAVFAALGATLSDEDPDPETMVGAESSFRLTPAGKATGNVVFYPKVNSLVIDEDARAGLSEAQLGVLQDAADATRDWVLDTLPSDAEAAATFCDQAGTIGAASSDQLDSLVAATRGVVDDLRADPTTARIIDAVEVLAEADPAAEPITGCGGAEPADTSRVDGTYTVTVTADQARADGVTDQGTIDENAGEYTITLSHGTWSAEQRYTSGPKTGTLWHGTGGLSLEGDRLTWFWSQEPGDETAAEVTVTTDGSLSFSQIEDGNGHPDAQAISRAFFSTWVRAD